MPPWRSGMFADLHGSLVAGPGSGSRMDSLRQGGVVNINQITCALWLCPFLFHLPVQLLVTLPTHLPLRYPHAFSSYLSLFSCRNYIIQWRHTWFPSKLSTSNG